jgi:hypothetical protein
MTSQHFFRLADDISKASSATRTILIPRPIPAVGAAAEPDIVDRNMEIPWLWDTLDPAFRQRIWNICSQTAERRGVELFLQPETTIDANQFTKTKYTAHSMRLLGREPFHLREGSGEDDVVKTHSELLELILQRGRKGLGISRYKGLGEMNPDQLSDTTMNADTRTMLQVKIEDAVEADQIFTTLMGDVVEPRREFIEKNALNVQNLDV